MLNMSTDIDFNLSLILMRRIPPEGLHFPEKDLNFSIWIIKVTRFQELKTWM